MTSSLRDLIADGRVHVCDGAMGTMLYSKGVFVNVCYDELSLTQPRLVQEVHEQYVAAGAEVLETNTFGANPVKLAGYGLAERTEEINHAAAALARRAANRHALVVGAIGPLGIRIEPLGPTSRDEARAYFARQARGLAEGGVDGFILETFADPEELHQALLAVRAACDLPVIAQMTVDEDGSTALGTDVETLARQLAAWGADVVGLNCSTGPAMMLDAIERMATVTDRPLAAQPNAGLPRAVGDRRIYLSSPDYMANYARRLIGAGVKFIGGCCGTTPEHIRKIRDVVATLEPQRHHPVAVPRAAVTPPDGVTPMPLAERSPLGAKLACGEFVTTVELLPPKGWVTAPLLEQGRALRGAAVSAVSLLDGPRAQSRMGSIPAAIVLQRELGLEPLIHYTCRDRTMPGMLSDLLGAAAAGLRNLLIVTGDPPRMGPYEAGRVSDIDSIGLTNVAYRLNHGLDPGGNPIGEPTRFVIGVAVNQGALDLEQELARLYWKVDAGADFAITQPVFDVEQLAAFLKRAEAYRVPIIAGLWPCASLRNAEFLANEVPGIYVPDRVLSRMRTAQGKGAEAELAEGIAIAREVKDAVKGLVQGVQISAPLGRVDVALATLTS